MTERFLSPPTFQFRDLYTWNSLLWLRFTHSGVRTEKERDNFSIQSIQTVVINTVKRFLHETGQV